MSARRLLILLPVAVVAWAAIDLSRPPSGDLRKYDPVEVARLETEMWRSYYDRRQVDLFRQLAELVRSQYQLPYLRSYLTAYYAGHAAFVFKDGKSRGDYEKALPDIERFYRAVLRPPADPPEAARMELEWWIVHRERTSRPPGALEHSLAQLQAAIYGGGAARFEEHARYRAEAMTLRDDKAAGAGVTPDDWNRIDELLRRSWSSHRQAVHKQEP